MQNQTKPSTNLDMPSTAALTVQKRLRDAQQTTEDPCTIDAVRTELMQEMTPRATRALVQFRPTITYQNFGGVRCMVIVPPDVKVVKTVLYLFGGAYISGAPEYELPITARLARDCRVRIVLPYYSLAPENPFPSALNEVVSVYKELSSSLDQEITIVGESSGGGLALSVAHELRSHGLSAPRALCLFSPWVDLTETGINTCSLIDDPSTPRSLLRLGAASYSIEKDYLPISPLYMDPDPDFPPMYISTGTSDILLPMLKQFVARHPNVDIQIWPNMWHVFELFDELPESDIALNYAASFIVNKLENRSF